MSIATDRLLLRRFREDDFMTFHRFLSDPAVMAYAPTLPHDRLSQTRNWLDGRLGIACGSGEDFVIEHRGRVIGKAGFPAFPEIGFLIGRRFWGKGFASEAVQAVIERGFAVHRLEKVAARVDPDNESSLRLLKKLGFIVTRLERNAILVGTKWCDDVHLELEAADFTVQTGTRERP